MIPAPSYWTPHPLLHGPNLRREPGCHGGTAMVPRRCLQALSAALPLTTVVPPSCEPPPPAGVPRGWGKSPGRPDLALLAAAAWPLRTRHHPGRALGGAPEGQRGPALRPARAAAPAPVLSPAQRPFLEASTTRAAAPGPQTAPRLVAAGVGLRWGALAAHAPAPPGPLCRPCGGGPPRASQGGLVRVTPLGLFGTTRPGSAQARTWGVSPGTGCSWPRAACRPAPPHQARHGLLGPWHEPGWGPDATARPPRAQASRRGGLRERGMAPGGALGRGACRAPGSPAPPAPARLAVALPETPVAVPSARQEVACQRAPRESRQVGALPAVLLPTSGSRLRGLQTTRPLLSTPRR
jgi:hypothetical protein